MGSFDPRRFVTVTAGGVVLFGLVATGCQSPQAGPQIPFVRERLENGLTVIYHQDRTLPLVTVNTWYYVGSKDESPGRSGFAHLFEHLLFMGTQRVPLGGYDRIIETNGGSNNASTSPDRTNYFESGPSHLLETFLYLEADRMEGYGRGIDREKLDTQRGVVRNERRQSYENRPYGKSFLDRWPLLYPEGHPYHNPVIGSHVDLERATVADVKDFFQKFYIPANASLVVAGDFDLEEAKRLVRKYYAPIPAGVEPAHAKAAPASLKGESRKTLADQVQMARVSLIYHSPEIFAEGDADLDIAGEVLGGGKSGRLYRSLVYERKIAQDVAAHQSSQHLGSTFEVVATARPGQDPAALEKALDEEIQRFLTTPPTDKEIERARNGYEMSFWARIESLGNRADLLNIYQFHFGDPGAMDRDLGRYRQVTPASVQTWAKKVLGTKDRLVLTVVPEGKAKVPEAAEAADAGTQPAAPEALAAPAAPEPPTDLLPPKPPVPGAQAAFLPPVPAVTRLECGVPLWVLPSHQAPIVSLALLATGAGASSDPAGRSGLAALTASMLDEGAGNLGALEISDAIDLLGASLSPSVARERGELRLLVLRRNLDRALDLFADILLRPRFEEKEWERIRTLTLNELAQRKNNPTAVARLVADRNFFGDGHPYGSPASGFSSSVGALSLEDLKRFYAERWKPDGAAIVASGDIAPEELAALLNARLKGWKASGVTPPQPPAAPAPRRRLLLVDKAEAPQTVISISMPGIPRVDPDYAGCLLANTIFGGSFTSRLNLNLREEHKFTYGARSEFHRLRGPGAFIIQTSVKTDVTGQALTEIARECRGMEKGITVEDLEKAKATARTGAVEAFSTVMSSTEVLAMTAGAGLPPDEPRRVLAGGQAASAEDVLRAARRVVRWDDATVVLVGDLKALRQEIEGAAKAIQVDGLAGEAGKEKALPDAVVLDAEGNPTAGS